jgi:hypothetical protein
VWKAKLTSESRSVDGTTLKPRTLYLCPSCGGAHEIKPELCHACGASLAGVAGIPNILRIDNVETQPTERITANDEERQRQGFDIQTIFRWPEDLKDLSSAIATDGGVEFARLDYAPRAEISRLNNGLRRRKEEGVRGFRIEVASGRWVGEDPDGQTDLTVQAKHTERVVPIVQDRKNLTLLRPLGDLLSKTTMTTLQHALAQGVAQCFQLEEVEIQSEPTPSREDRRCILFYESSEGGAGVLSRFVRESGHLSRVAKAALSLMHYDHIDEAVAACDPGLLESQSDANCVKGCYRCLLSYYNQPDHEGIDRTDEATLLLLLRMAGAKLTHLRQEPEVATAAPSTWRAACARWNLPIPDSTPDNAVEKTPLVWDYHAVVAYPRAILQSELAAWDARGFAVIELASTPPADPPHKLLELLGVGEVALEEQAK